MRVAGLLLCVLLQGSSACQSRSGQDTERVESHQGTEPSYHDTKPDPYHEVAGHEGHEEKEPTHEEGELQVLLSVLSPP